MSSEATSEAEQHIAKLSPENLKEIISLTVKIETSGDVSQRIETFSKKENSKVDVCTYQCTPEGCNFSELLSWVSKYQNNLVADMMDDEMKNSCANAVCAKISENVKTVKPRDYEGYYFHHHNTPILFLKNDEVSHPLYTHQRAGKVASIDVENLAFYTMKTMKKGAMNDYMSKLRFTSSWQELAINAGAGVLAVSSVVLAMRSKKSRSGISPMFLGGLSVGMFALNRYGQQQKSNKTKS